MSLVELLIAVAILAIIAGPLIGSFVTSARTAARSRAVGDATIAAQSIAETIDATHMSDIAGSFCGGKDAGLPSYSWELESVSAGSSTFDARITLEALPEGADGTTQAAVTEINAAEITQYTPMGAVFSQADDADETARRQFAEDAGSRTGDTYDESFFVDKTRRNINITVEKDPDSGKITVTTTYIYSCSFNYTLTAAGEDGVVEATEYTDELSYTYSSMFYRDDLTSIYFFYFPNYGCITSGSYYDCISIRNLDNVQFSFFLIKQKTPGMKDSELNQAETRYMAQVMLYERIADARYPNMQLFTNISKNVSGQTQFTTSHMVYAVKSDYENAVPPFYGTASDKLVSTTAENRMYYVTIEILDADGKNVYTLNTTKLD